MNTIIKTLGALSFLSITGLYANDSLATKPPYIT